MQTIDEVVRRAKLAGLSYGYYVHYTEPPTAKPQRPKKQADKPQAVPKPEPAVPLASYRTCLHAEPVEDLRQHLVTVKPSCPNKERNRSLPQGKQFRVWRGK